jgi:protocatechuate 3,4-dioxygenase beta subunit
MSVARLRHLGVALALVGVAATVAVAARPHPPATEDPPPLAPAPVVAAAPAPEKQPAPAAPPVANGMTFFGSVQEPDGKPVPNARVMITVVPRRPVPDNAMAAEPYKLLGHGPADERGAFELTVPPTDTAKLRGMAIVAKAPGYGFSALNVVLDFRDKLRLNVPKPLVLIPAGPARARLLDPSGKPAGAVTVHVLGMRRTDGGTGVDFPYPEPPVPLPGWPGPLLTDADGYFSVPDVVPGTLVFCQTRDERYANEWIQFTAPANDRAKPPEIQLTPGRVLAGRVLTGDTGQPLADVTVAVETPAVSGKTLRGYVETRTDADGRYSLKPFPGPAMKVFASPPAGAPYPVLTRDLKWPAEDALHDLDLPLPRGVLVRGRVEEQGSGRPLAGAAVDYEWADRYEAKAPRPAADVSVRSAVTGPDGTFAFAVPAGSGHVVVKAAEPDYLHTEIALGALRGYGKGGRPAFPDALAPLRLAPGAEPQDVTLRLRRGVTVRGRVVGPDGTPVRQATLYATHYIPRGIEPGEGRSGLLVQDGRFELPGCEPGSRFPVWVYDARGRRAAMADLTGDPGKEQEVRLAPTVAARARIVDQSGLPVTKPELIFLLVQRPGADPNDSQQTGARAMVTTSARLVHDTEDDVVVDRMNNVILPGLIPGATYTFVPHSGYNWGTRQTFAAPATGTLDLGRSTIPGLK